MITIIIKGHLQICLGLSYHSWIVVNTPQNVLMTQPCLSVELCTVH